MRKITFLTVLAISFAISINATVWRVNNNTQVDADFNDLQTAINDANVLPFDTLYVEGSNTDYGYIDVNKPLIIIGTGYFLNENDSTQAIKYSSILKDIDFKNGSSGSVICGCSFLTAIGDGNIKIGTDSITISRNYIKMVEFANHFKGISVYSDNLSDIILENNYILVHNDWGSKSAIAINLSNSGMDIIIQNNYLSGGGDNPNICYALNLSEEINNNYKIRNNVIQGNILSNDGTYLNNILIEGEVTGSNNFNNNIGNATQFGNANGNQENVDMTTVLVDHLSEVDNGLILKAGSPAIGAGFSGEDCGMFGGNRPYVLSGIPPIPAIFEIENTGIGNSTLPIEVHMKAKSNR